MAAPPAKRQRRSKVVFADNEEEEPKTAEEHTSRPAASSTAASSRKVTTLPKFATSIGPKSKSKPNVGASKPTPRKAAPKPEPVSPNKPKKSPRKKEIKENSLSLHTFFGRASEEQRWNRKTDTPTQEVDDDVENGDAIEDDDDSLDEAYSQLVEGQEDLKFQLDRRKDRATVTKNGSQTVRPGHPTSTHKFVKPPVPSIKKHSIDVEMEDSSKKHLHRPWADRYGPANLEELAVHKKKVADVQKWLGEVLNGRDSRVCAIQNIIPSSPILTGP
jgi:cell cycle checkpoint protein